MSEGNRKPQILTVGRGKTLYIKTALGTIKMSFDIRSDQRKVEFGLPPGMEAYREGNRPSDKKVPCFVMEKNGTIIPKFDFLEAAFDDDGEFIGLKMPTTVLRLREGTKIGLEISGTPIPKPSLESKESLTTSVSVNASFPAGE